MKVEFAGNHSGCPLELFGAKYLSDALQTSNVRLELTRLMYYLSRFCFEYSVTAVLLRCDQIKDDETGPCVEKRQKKLNSD